MVDLNKLYERDEDAALENYAAGLQTTPEGYPYYQAKPGKEHLKLPVSMPEKFVQALTGGDGQERYQLWPEKIVRSALSLPTDVLSGRVPTGVGLRKESYTDNPNAPEPLAPLIERAQDMSALATGAPLAMKPGLGGSVMAKSPEQVRLYRGEFNHNEPNGGYYTTNKAEAENFGKVRYVDVPQDVAEFFKMPGMKDVYHIPNYEAGPGNINWRSKSTLLSDSEAGTALTAVAKSNAPTFFSSLEQAVKNSKMNSGTAEQWTGYLRNQPGVKTEELSYSGLENLPKGQISKAELEKHIGENGTKLGEEWKTSIDKTKLSNDMNMTDFLDNNYQHFPDNPTKYHSYQLPGGEPGSYKELLLTLPNSNAKADAIYDQMFKYNNIPNGVLTPEYKKLKAKYDDLTREFKSSHWSEPNILAHVRMNDRDFPNVGKSLHIEELQSDWHQKGRKEGYKLSKEQKEKLEPEFNKIDDKIVNSGDEAVMGNPDIREAIKDAVSKKIITEAEGTSYLRFADSERVGAVPDAPFKKTWDDLAIKRMIREASEKGYDAISWTPGEAQAARYDLSKQIEKLHVIKTDKGYLLGPEMKSGQEAPINNGLPIAEDKLADHVGKELAEKILNSNYIKGGHMHTFDNVDLKIGGEGMKGFYDQMLVAKVNAIAKKFGGKVEQQEVKAKPVYEIRATGLSKNGDELHSVYNDRGNLMSDFKNKAEAEKYVKEKEATDTVPKIHVLKLPPDLKKHATEKGFPLFSGGPTLIPVDHNPFSDDKKKYRLVPVPGNPFND